MEERGVDVDHSTLNRWVVKYADTDIEMRQNKYLNNLVEQHHRAVNRMTRPTLGFKSFRSAAATLAGVEVMHMIRKGQMRTTGKLRPAQQFYALAAETSPVLLRPFRPR